MERIWFDLQCTFEGKQQSAVRIGAALLLLVATALSLTYPAPVYASEYAAATLLGFTFTFDGKTYDPVRDESTWHYTVTGPMVSGPTYKDLSHWILALCTPHVVVEASGNKWERRTKPDPHHGLIGIKWDDKVDKQGSASFYFVLKGDWAVDLSVAVAAKAGPGKESGLLPGPACQADSCRIDYDLTTRNDWRFAKAGTYAAGIMQIGLHGDTSVRMLFDDFHDSEHVSPWASAPPIEFRYSVGATLEEAESHGWLPPNVFNGWEVIIDKAAVSRGALLYVWARADVTDATMSSEYRGGGRVAIELLCD